MSQEEAATARTRIHRESHPASWISDDPSSSSQTPGADDTIARAGRTGMNYAIAAVVTSLVFPIITPLLAILGVRRCWEPVLSGEGDFRCTSAVVISTAAGLCSLLFWISWILLRPSPLVLLQGWRGLRGLPAIPAGFQRSSQDPYGFTIGSWHTPGAPAQK